MDLDHFGVVRRQRGRPALVLALLHEAADVDRHGVGHGDHRPAARRTVLPHVRLPGLSGRHRAARGRAALRPRGQRREGVVRVRVAARAARGVRQDRHGPGPGPRDERILLLDQPRGRLDEGRRGDLHSALHHHPAERHRVGHRAGVVPFRALPRRAEQMALHPGAADRRAVHRLVPPLADDTARDADSGLHALRGDDERPVAFAPRVPGRGDAVGHPAMPRDGADRPRNARSLPQPAHNDPRGHGLRCRIRLPLESRQHLHHAGTVRRFARLPAHHRLHLQFDSQTAPARPYIKLPGHHQRPARNRLQRQPGENRHRLGQLLGQGLPRRDPDQIRVRPRKAHRLHLLHRGRGVGIPRLGRGADAAVPADPAADAHGRTAAGAVRTHLLLLRGGDPAVPRAGQRGHDHRPDARDGHSAAVYELRRLVAHRLHDPAVHRRAARRLDTTNFPYTNYNTR